MRPHHHAETVHFDLWLATNRSFPDSADFQAHESKKKRMQRASAASEAARSKRCRALSPVYPRKCRPAEMETQQSEDREVVCVVLVVKMSQCVPPRDAFTHQD